MEKMAAFVSLVIDSCSVHQVQKDFFYHFSLEIFLCPRSPDDQIVSPVCLHQESLTHWWQMQYSISHTVKSSELKGISDYKHTHLHLQLFIKITNYVGYLLVFAIAIRVDFRRIFGGSISIMAQCIETQLMPNESSGKDLQIMCGHCYVRSLLHGVICVTKCQRPSNCFFLFFLLSFFLLFYPGHDLFTISKQLAKRFQRNFTCILMGSVRITVQNFIDLMVDLDLSRSQI